MARGGEAGGLVTTVVAGGGQECGGGLIAVDVMGGAVAGELVDRVVAVRRCRAVGVAGAARGAVAVGVVAVAVGHRRRSPGGGRRREAPTLVVGIDGEGPGEQVGGVGVPLIIVS